MRLTVDLGSGPLALTTEYRYNNGTWYKISFSRNKKQGRLQTEKKQVSAHLQIEISKIAIGNIIETVFGHFQCHFFSSQTYVTLLLEGQQCKSCARFGTSYKEQVVQKLLDKNILIVFKE